ncbi:MAG: hypothetical protein Q4G50_14580 [Corynebacterium sp.]|uniref:hypothetical protein n=1 Tax=Corynebacterium sp. TaxID=1720 RepID=UPI0026E002EB|nr:hypothetical protein [Corynebacterium sp.]MDO5671214.1 hypothetical protein [Corynebacterium sp.]
MNRTLTRTSSLITYGVVVFFILSDVFTVLRTRTFDAAVTPLLDPSLTEKGRLTWEAIAGGPAPYYVAGYAVSVLALLAAATLLMLVGLDFSRTGGVIRRMPALVNAAMFAVLGWGVGQFITHIGNNFAANIHDVQDQWNFMTTINQQTLVLWLLFLTVLSTIVYVLRHSVDLEQETEDLV